MAEEIANRMIRMFTLDGDNRRQIFGNNEKFQKDPHWRDNLFFYEYFHGDSGMGWAAPIRPVGPA
jgi:hypothetical protein